MAPDINYIDGQYVLYYSVSTVGSQNSIIDSNDGDGLNGLKLTFGSCWNGMYQVGLWPNIKTRASDLPGHVSCRKQRPRRGWRLRSQAAFVSVMLLYVLL